MKRHILRAAAVIFAPIAAFAVDGVVLINQSALTTAGGTYTITQPGSYKLSSNLVAKDINAKVIVVSVDNVTIDLNGFTIMGPNKCVFTPPITCSSNTGQSGISIGFFINNLTVMNGTITGMGGDGISADGLGNRIESVTVSGNGGNGIYIRAGLIDHCSVFNNGANGIVVSTQGGTLRRSYVAQNALAGFNSDFPSWGYSQNNFQSNAFGFNVPQVVGIAANLGQNQCGNAACPGALY